MSVGFDLGYDARYFIQYLLVAIFTSYVLVFITKNVRKPTQKIEDAFDGSETKVLRLPQGFKWIGWADIVFFAACLILSIIFPGNTKNLLFAQSTFAFFVLLGAYIVYLTHCSTVLWHEKTVTAYNFWGTQRIVFRWEEVEKIIYHPRLRMLSFQLRNRTEKAWMQEMYEGMFEFYTHLLLHYRHLPFENATWDELEASLKEEPDWDELEVPEDHEKDA